MSSVVTVTQLGAHRSQTAAVRSQETPRPLCLYIVLRPRFVLLAFRLVLAYLVRLLHHIPCEHCLLSANVALIITLASNCQCFSLRVGAKLKEGFPKWFYQLS